MLKDKDDGAGRCRKREHRDTVGVDAQPGVVGERRLLVVAAVARYRRGVARQVVRCQLAQLSVGGVGEVVRGGVVKAITISCDGHDAARKGRLKC